MNAIANMPYAVQHISYIVPARYFIAALRSIYLKGVGLSALWMETLLLVVFALSMLLAARVLFKKKMS